MNFFSSSLFFKTKKTIPVCGQQDTNNTALWSSSQPWTMSCLVLAPKKMIKVTGCYQPAVKLTLKIRFQLCRRLDHLVADENPHSNELENNTVGVVSLYCMWNQIVCQWWGAQRFCPVHESVLEAWVRLKSLVLENEVLLQSKVLI